MIKNIIHKLGLNKILIFRKILDLIKGTLRSTAIPFPVRIQGFWMKRISVGDFLYGAYESETTRLVKKLITPNFTFVDVGADYGYYSLLVAKLSKDRANIYTFEPHESRCREYLFPNIKRNSFKNIHVYNQALSDTNQPVKFFPEVTSLYDIKNTNSLNVQTVSCNLLDNILSRDVNVDLVKIDVEGAELNVIKGMKRILTENQNIKLIIEINPAILSKVGIKLSDISNYLKLFDFNIYKINKDGLLTKFNNDFEILNYAIAHKYINVLCQKE